MNRPICKRCFFQELDPNGMYQKISDLISLLPQEKRTDDKTYAKRLEICGKCDSLGEGTCGECGCFVELRAAKKEMHCPHEKHYW